MSKIKKTWKQYKVAYVYIAPFFILFAIFGLFPIAYGFYLSFFRWDGLSAMHFVGITNYINIFKALHAYLWVKTEPKMSLPCTITMFSALLPACSEAAP